MLSCHLAFQLPAQPPGRGAACNRRRAAARQLLPAARRRQRHDAAGATRARSYIAFADVERKVLREMLDAAQRFLDKFACRTSSCRSRHPCRKDINGIFQNPVTEAIAPLYFQIIKFANRFACKLPPTRRRQPMDLGTMRRQIQCGFYSSIEQYRVWCR